MLLGYYSGASVFQPAGFSVAGRSGNPREFNFEYFAPYVQDDWKVSSRLTMNMGLRWDYRTIPVETNDRMGWRDLSNPRGGMLVADQTLVDSGIVGDSSYYKFAGRRNPKDASKNVFAPRLGFAFRPFRDAKTVVRADTGCSGIPSKDGRSTAPRTSIHMSAGAITSRRRTRPRRSRRPTTCSPASPPWARRRLPRTRSWR